jgi:hypothetical protein
LVSYDYLSLRREQFRIESDVNGCLLNQEEANRIFQGYQYDPSFRYSEVIRQALTAAFFAYAVPGVAFLALVSILVINKVYYVVLVRFSAIPN